MPMEHFMYCKRPGEDAIYDAFRVDGAIQVSPQGGGFVIANFATADQFNTEFELAELPTAFMAGTVTADFFEDVGPIDCYSDGKHWNGWGVPAFDFVAATQLVEIFKSDAAKDGTPPGLRIVDGEFQEYDSSEELYYPCASFTKEIDGKQIALWQIGDGWCWDAVELKVTTPAKRISLQP
jgi:hypothetical protein